MNTNSNYHQGLLSTTDKVLMVLRQSGALLDAAAVEAAVRSTFPGSVIGKGSVASILSSRQKKGVVMGTRPSPFHRMLYGLASAGRRAIEEPAVPDALPPAPTGGESSFREKRLPVSMGVAPQTHAAVLDLSRALYRADNHRAQGLLMDHAASLFAQDRPDRDPRFFAVKFQSAHINRVVISFGITDRATLAYFDRLLVDSGLADRGISKDGRQAGDKKVTRVVIGHTALVWYLATRLTEAQQSLPGVALFLEYAERNYRNKDGIGIVTVYRSICRDLGLAGGPLLPAAAQAQPVPAEAGPVAGGFLVDPATRVAPVPAAAPPYRLQMESDHAGGLRVSIHLSPEIIGGLLYALTQALDVVTRSAGD